MLTLFHQSYYSTENAVEDLEHWPDLTEEINKTRTALDIAYAGFNYALDEEVIDSYIYEINALLKRYNHLDSLKKQVVSATPLFP